MLLANRKLDSDLGSDKKPVEKKEEGVAVSATAEGILHRLQKEILYKYTLKLLMSIVRKQTWYQETSCLEKPVPVVINHHCHPGSSITLLQMMARGLKSLRSGHKKKAIVLFLLNRILIF